MLPRLPSLLDRPVAFGEAVADPRDHDGPVDPSDEPEQGVSELTLVLDRGATALASPVWLTADGVPVLDRTGRTGSRWRRRPIAKLTAAELPPSATRLDDLYRTIGPTRPLSLDVRDPDGFAAVIEAARATGDGTEERLWLCHDDLTVLASWRSRTSARLVNGADYRSLPGGLERRAAELEERDIDGLRLAHRDWSGGRVTLLHRFGRLALAGGLVYDREVAAVLDAGIDGVYSTEIEPMVAVLAEFYGEA